MLLYSCNMQHFVSLDGFEYLVFSHEKQQNSNTCAVMTDRVTALTPVMPEGSSRTPWSIKIVEGGLLL